jgi:hypothetical protein
MFTIINLPLLLLLFFVCVCVCVSMCIHIHACQIKHKVLYITHTMDGQPTNVLNNIQFMTIIKFLHVLTLGGGGTNFRKLYIYTRE